ncbi:MFS transporter [Ramlibacter sp. USB13]|uniref:MFS transporter n=2 Tax=Ramlibacter cellulosilyticus TaxID=2764187 RepID=A0A923MX94_9BURK|nr:MFS transporter [Ramlibacter cellulosilyticus]
MAGMRMAAPLMALRAGYSELAVGVLLSLYALMQVFLSLPAGRYADRHGLKRPFAISVGAACLGGALAFAWPVFPVLCVAALLTGGATGGAVIALQRHVGRAAHTPEEIKRAFSWLAIGPAFSNFVGPFAAGLVIDHAGFRAAFLMLALMPLATWYFVRQAHELAPVVQPHGAHRGKAWDLWRDPSFRRLILVNWFLSSAWDVHTFVVPVLGHERGLSASVIGTILGLFAFSAAAIRVFLPMLAARVHEWVLIVTAMAATTVIYAVYPFMHVALTMGLCSVLLGFALGMVQPMVMSMLHQITPEHRHGEAVGMRMLVINASSVAMPMLFGTAGAVVGISAVFWTVAATVGGGIRVAWRLKDIKAGRSSG